MKMRHSFLKKREKRKMIKITSLKLWFPVFWILTILLYRQPIPTLLENLLFLFAIMVGLLTGYRIYQKLDYNPTSDSGIFGLKLLSGGVSIAGFLAFFISFFMILFGGVKQYLGDILMGIFFAVLGFSLMVLSAYLLFKYKRRAGIIIFRG